MTEGASSPVEPVFMRLKEGREDPAIHRRRIITSPINHPMKTDADSNFTMHVSPNLFMRVEKRAKQGGLSISDLIRKESFGSFLD